MPHGPALRSELSCSLFPVPGVPRVGTGHVAPMPGSPFEALSHLCTRSFNASFGSWYFLSAVIRVPGHLPCNEKAPQRSRSWQIAVFAKGRFQQTLAVSRYRHTAALFRLRGGIITLMVYVITCGGGREMLPGSHRDRLWWWGSGDCSVLCGCPGPVCSSPRGLGGPSHGRARNGRPLPALLCLYSATSILLGSCSGQKPWRPWVSALHQVHGQIVF